MRKMLAVMAAAVLSISVFAPAAMAATDIENQISSKLVEAFGDDGKAIKVTVFEGTATLIGRVAERSTLELAEQVALYFPEIKKVDNELKSDKVKSVSEGKLGDEATDAKLETEVKSALASEVGSHAKDIEVEAAAGMVSVRGTVPDESRYKLAIAAAKGVKGVTKVIDLLRIAK